MLTMCIRYTIDLNKLGDFRRIRTAMAGLDQAMRR